MANEELKQALGDDLCDYCPWKSGEIDHRCDSLCEGLYCDDALDAFGVHGIGGIIGSVLTGVFATQAITGEGGVQGALYGDWHQLWIQVAATLISIVFSAVMTFVLFKVVDKLAGIRVDKRVEEEGLDVYEHGESAYDL